MKFRRNIIRQNLRRRFSVGWKNLFLDWRRFGCIECPHLKRAAANSFRIDGSFELLWFPKVLCRKYRSWNVPIELENSLKIKKTIKLWIFLGNYPWSEMRSSLFSTSGTFSQKCKLRIEFFIGIRFCVIIKINKGRSSIQFTRKLIVSILESKISFILEGWKYIFIEIRKGIIFRSA